MSDPVALGGPAAQADGEALRLQHHAMRQPLNALGLFCAALKMQPLTPAQQPLVAGIQDAAELLERLVDQHFHALGGGGPEPQTLAGQSLANPEAPAQDPQPARDLTAHEPLSVQGGSVPFSAGVAVKDSPAKGANPSGEPPSAWRIAVVDDDEAARLGMVLLLEAWGAAVQSFAGLRELRAWVDDASTTPPDLLILDYHLPRPGDGLEALRLLRQAWPGWKMRALLITGDERAAVANALTDGSLQCLVKPLAPGPLLAALRQQLGSQFGV